MGFYINPARGKGPENIPETQSKKADKESAVKHTASRVERVAPFPASDQGWEIQLYNEAKGLSKRISREWNLLTPSELAEHIIDLEGKVTQLEKGTSVNTAKIKLAAQKLHFQFVFPIVLELKRAPEANMPDSFARTVQSVAKQILQTNSLDPIKRLSSVQIDEMMRYARGGK